VGDLLHRLGLEEPQVLDLERLARPELGSFEAGLRRFGGAPVGAIGLDELEEPEDGLTRRGYEGARILLPRGKALSAEGEREGTVVVLRVFAQVDGREEPAARAELRLLRRLDVGARGRKPRVTRKGDADHVIDCETARFGEGRAGREENRCQEGSMHR
jgi:hypothetical protein